MRKLETVGRRLVPGAMQRCRKPARSKRTGGFVTTQYGLDPEALFDVHIKRIHEYKRQLLNVLHVVALYHRIAGGDSSAPPRVVLFGGKAAPSYRLAKLIIALIHSVAAMVRANPRVARQLSMEFVPNYGVSAAQVLFPATDLSEHISPAGTEASGTGNMKRSEWSGDHRDARRRQHRELQSVGADNIEIFGHKAEEIVRRCVRTGIGPGVGSNDRRSFAQVIETIAGWRADGVRGMCGHLTAVTATSNAADFASYIDHPDSGRGGVGGPGSWTRMVDYHTARSGPFSFGSHHAPSTNRDIWHTRRSRWNCRPLLLRRRSRRLEWRQLAVAFCSRHEVLRIDSAASSIEKRQQAAALQRLRRLRHSRQPICPVSRETEPPSMPSSGKVTASPGSCAPRT